ncbi:aminotransferase class I/II-fold pyridoxal phosphate-dependent enzyme [Ruegeria pomeroyi]|uniref:Aminotransferase class I/II-fold pyridoxal phosphate-dependent enzyme n=1 Tax=Ruegeria pomeroyi TaxID=89184 RepID=A0A850LE21_9RHOB|nr:aminotransferase class I/II-fold pyridoxal phosphate-dependent enzyme [Ruegeria pomeroyi]NVK96296.1 aminotransferase class I/II-fold pyridoxal phosphate-dependent enzyme [Ruegeria pomeroyi]NVL00242.1 aminotransferase class I/II-fold pyridoxal phosphate-dependent enzyme [Ruegeria pomeroyi]QWV10286.1 aminotransferase class I/II-fold pyridoxal phosphate-dependent enzyme [Ruegeria pomeroyi]HCE72199.1 serine hydroxymethyltransferase [Ruegeria sp.]
MPQLAARPWVPAHCETRVQQIAETTARADSDAIDAHLEALIEENRTIHDAECFNLNPATNVMNPRAEAVLARGLGSRPSLGYPGDKYEMGLEAIEEIEVIAAELAAKVFNARYAEIRVGSGALANLYGFMALTRPGDTIIAPPASIGGHVTHHKAGCAGLYGLKTIEAPVDADGYSLDLSALAELAERHRPRLITVGGSLNLFPHPVAAVREIADRVGAKVLFDAAHQCGIIAGGAWANPLDEGAHLMTMSTYKSLGGPAGGLIVTNEAEIAERLDAIAFPGMTANFDAAKSAALAISLLDWVDHGAAYAQAMVDLAQALAAELEALGLPVFHGAGGATASHQFAVEAARFGGGQAASKTLRRAGFLACGIGLPIAPVAGDMNGLRIGTPELVRRGVTPEHAAELAWLITQGLTGNDPEAVALRTREMRARFQGMHHIRS